MNDVLSVLESLFVQGLGLEIKEREFWLGHVPEIPGTYCGVDSRGNLCLAFPHSNQNYPMNLSGLTLIVDANLLVRHGNSNQALELTCDIVTFGLGRNGFDQDSALSLASAVLLEFDSDKSKEISDIIRSLSELLRARPENGSEIGLWGELLMIYVSDNVDHAIQGWGNNPNRVFDFQWEGSALEIKTSTSPSRNHHYSLSQLRLNESTPAFVCSIVTQEIQNGVTIPQLRDRIISDRLPSFDSQRIFLTRLATSGIELRNSRSYSLETAVESAFVFEFWRIAQVQCGPEIVDLTWSTAPPLETEKLLDWRGPIDLSFSLPGQDN